MATIERFLPIGSKVAIQRQGQPAEWYTTIKEVTLPEQPVTTECPLTGAEVRTVLVESTRLFYHQRMSRGRVVLEQDDVTPEAAETQFCLFHYDCPANGEFPNPSGRLYPLAVRLTESAWLMRTGDIPYALMGEMQDAGCTVEVNRFDIAESGRLLRQAVGKLQEELADAVRRADEAMERATDTLAAQGTEANERSPEDAEKFYLSRCGSIQRRLTALQKQVAESSARFGIRPQAINLERLSAAAATIKSEMAERAAAYREGIKALEAAGTVETIALAKAAARDEVPAEVMAGALEDAGDEAGAARLQAAFAVPAEAETFSLADLGDDEAA